MDANTEDKGILSARGFAENHDPDLDHAFQVTESGLALFDCTRDLHGLGDREQRLLHAAALMHDTGYETQPMKHHKGSRDMILGSKMGGFSMQELMMVACIARYHRKSDPDKSHKVYRDLDSEAQSVVERLAAILRVADGLDRSHLMSAGSLRVEREGNTLRLYVKQRHDNPTDVFGAMRKRGLFEKVFGVELEIIPE